MNVVTYLSSKPHLQNSNGGTMYYAQAKCVKVTCGRVTFLSVINITSSIGHWSEILQKNVAPVQVFFTHFSSVSQLLDYSIIGRLVQVYYYCRIQEVLLYKILMVCPQCLRWRTIYFAKLAHFRPSCDNLSRWTLRVKHFWKTGTNFQEIH